MSTIKNMKTFQIEGFGNVGSSNMTLGVEANIGKHWDSLEIGESCEVEIRGDRVIQAKIKGADGKRKMVKSVSRVTRIV